MSTADEKLIRQLKLDLGRVTPSTVEEMLAEVGGFDSPDQLSFSQLREFARNFYTRFSGEMNLWDLSLLLSEEQQIGLLIRRRIIDAVILRNDVTGNLSWADFGSRIVPLTQMPSTDSRFPNAFADVVQHMENNDDWTVDYYLRSYLGLEVAKDDVFVEFLETLVHPCVRDTPKAQEYVALVNAQLLHSGFELVKSSELSGFPIWKVSRATLGSQLKNKLQLSEDLLAGKIETFIAALLGKHDSVDLARRQYPALRKELKNHPTISSSIPYYMEKARDYDDCVRRLPGPNDFSLNQELEDFIFDCWNPILDSLESLNLHDSQEFEVLETLGQGGFGVVYKVRDRLVQKQFALKICSPYYDSDGARARAYREASVLLDLFHENIVRLFRVLEVNGNPAILMEYVEGHTLRQLLQGFGLFSPAKALLFATKVASALEHAHELNVVHRDLKPSNVILRKPGVVKVLDFGMGTYVEWTGPVPADIGNKLSCLV